MLFRYRGQNQHDTGQLWFGCPGDPKSEGYEVGKIYCLGPDSRPLNDYPERFDHVDEPPDCRTASQIALPELAERCTAFIEWMKGPIAQSLDWNVPQEYKVRSPEGYQDRTANR